MMRLLPIRFAVFSGLLLVGVSGSGALRAQTKPMMGQSKPSAAIQNTNLPATQTTAAPLAAPVTQASRRPGEMPPRRAEVKYQNGQLAVSADNSSLNQILREIGQQTKTKITGGVTDERVFGSYGPGEPADVLAELLDGTGTNVLLIAGSDTVANELILTPRNGGASPPSPSTFHEQAEPSRPVDVVDGPPEWVGVRGGGRPDVGARPTAQEQPSIQPQIESQRLPQAQPITNAAPPAAASPDMSTTPVAPAADSTQVESPNGVKTPQQIYDQLMKLHQQQTTTPP